MSTLVGVAVISQSSASAATFGPDGFMDINGAIRYDGVGSAGWANGPEAAADLLPTGTSGADLTTCSGGGVHAPGTNGIFDCGSATSNPTPANPGSGVFATAFTSGFSASCGGNYGYATSAQVTDDVTADQYKISTATPKDNIANTYAVARQGSQGNEVYVGLERPNPGGDTHVDFEFLQENVSLSSASPCGTAHFVSTSPSNGAREQGDVMLEMNYLNGGFSPTPTVYVWSCTGALVAPPTLPANGTPCSFGSTTYGPTGANWVVDPACPLPTQTGPGCYQQGAAAIATDQTGTPGYNATAQTISCGGWLCDPPTGSKSVPEFGFTEGAINLDLLGLGVGCESTMMAITRSSGAGPTSTLKYFSAPTPLDTCTPTQTVTTPKTGSNVTIGTGTGGSASGITLGATAYDVAVVSPTGTGVPTATPPTGTVNFYVCGPLTTAAGCSSTDTTRQPVGTASPTTGVLGSPTSNSTTFTSLGFTPTTVGIYCFEADYVPSGKFEPSQDTLSAECFAVGPIAPDFQTSPASNPITFGGTNTDTATVYGNAAGGQPAGSVQFYLCKETTVGTPCTDTSSTAKLGSPVNIAGINGTDNSSAQSPSANPGSAGTWCFNASYTAATGGNYSSVSIESHPQNNPSNECFTVNPQSSNATTQVTATSVTFGSGGITDTVSVSPSSGSGTPPTGTVQFYVCQTTGTFCSLTSSGTKTDGSPVTLTVPNTGSTSTANSPTFMPTSAGTWCFAAVYSGDGNYLGQQDNTTSANKDVNECVDVTQAGSATTTTVNDVALGSAWTSSETTGASAYDTASVAPSPTFTNAPVPTGTVSYTFFSNGSCTGTGTAAGTVTLDSSGHGPKSSNEGPLGAGSYSFQAVYSGDTNYFGSTGACEPFTVGQGTSATVTIVKDATSTATWSGSETTGASAYDTTTVTPSSGIVASGTVTYTFFSNSSCTGNGTPAGTVTLTSNGSVPKSNTEGPLGAGSYGFKAVYSGDTNYAGSTGACEPFTVGQGTSATVTTVNDVATSSGWSGTETTGSSAYDTTTVTPSSGIIATGTVTYTFFTNGTCAGTGAAAGTVTLTSAGGVPKSNNEGPLGAGSYSFQAAYSGDTNYAGSTGTCEPFTVGKGTSVTVTTVTDATSTATWSGTETTGASAYDTTTVTPSSGIVASGTVTYTFFSNSSCTGNGTPAGTVTLTSAGGVPKSNTEGPLGAGSYGFQAVYSGDTNYAGSTGVCEPFNVAAGPSATVTTVNDAANSATWSGSETTGATAYDTATVGPKTPFTGAPTPTGTVSYTFFSNGTCTGTGTAAGTVTLTSNGSVPNSDNEGPLGAGSYSFQAVYGGDTNYASSTGACEPFTVGQGTSATATTVFDAATNAAWTGAELGTPSAYDTATVTPSSKNIVATGTVTYTFFSNGICSGDGAAAGTVTLTSTGAVPNSNTEGPLAQGSYSFRARYAGDTNYAGSTGVCEPFTLAYPVINVVKSEPTPGNGVTVIAGVDTITYNLSITNTGLAPATAMTVTDVIPTGSTYKTGSANLGGVFDSTTKTISWAIGSGDPVTSVPAATDSTHPGTAGPLSFQVTVNAADADGSTITNQAAFSDINTVECTPGTVEGTCLTNQVSNPVEKPIINVVKSEPTPGDGQTVTAGQTAPITYSLSLTNTGSAAATAVKVTDVIPTGATYVSGSANAGGTYDSTTNTITWTVASVPGAVDGTAGTAGPLTFQVTVNSTDANGSTITNQAAFWDINTVNCTASTTQGFCLTNKVSNPVVVIVPTPATAPLVTTTTVAPKLAFTGANVRFLVMVAGAMLGSGMLVLLLGRRRRRQNG